MSKRGMKFTEKEVAHMTGKMVFSPGLDDYIKTQKKSKFHNVITEMDDMKFDSKKEAKYYSELKARVHLGEVKYFLRQIPLLLPGGIRYRVDFIEFWNDGSVHYVDVKGHRTDVYKMKKKLVESTYPIFIEEE
ncbi:MAG: DUF1064 domain-containing protein [Deltaproteobacteria bacterium]|nr:DUF1064 domain-containing protein [Deltaproteobacteria bacterium]